MAKGKQAAVAAQEESSDEEVSSRFVELESHFSFEEPDLADRCRPFALDSSPRTTSYSRRTK